MLKNPSKLTQRISANILEDRVLQCTLPQGHAIRVLHTIGGHAYLCDDVYRALNEAEKDNRLQHISQCAAGILRQAKRSKRDDSHTTGQI